MPALRWPGAYLPDGSQEELDLERVHCDDEFAGVRSLIFVVSAVWCPSCPDFIRNVSSMARSIEDSGGLIVYVETEDRNRAPARSRLAYDHIRELIGQGAGYRVGDADTRPQPMAIYNSPVVGGFPAAFVVRTRDMMVIADQQRSDHVLPFDRIAANPDGNWNDPQNPPVGPANCGPGDEEAQEPNDDPASAGRIGVGVVRGGICAAAPDFYRVDLRGDWRLDLGFRHGIGDLDVYVWDERAQEPLADGRGGRVGSESVDDNESFDWQGPAMIVVVGYEGATALYELSLSE